VFKENLEQRFALKNANETLLFLHHEQEELWSWLRQTYLWSSNNNNLQRLL